MTAKPTASPPLAAIQMNSGADVQANLATAEVLLKRAASAGAQLAVLPENFAFMGGRTRDRVAIAELDGEGPVQDFLADTAARLGLWIVAGTVALALPDEPERVAPACLVYGADGQRVARYDKIHLFDVELPGKGTRYRESDGFRPGAPTPCCVDTPVGRVGLSICYDLRFPELYRRMAADGAQLFTVPAAFTVPTGAAHWEVLLRARAIENLAGVVAPGQCGTHPDGHATYGHSLVLGAWGEVLAEVDSETAEGVAMAAVPQQRVAELRESFPALTHRRLSS